MRRSKFSKIFRTYLISYMVILLIPLITGFFTYQVSIDFAESSSIESSLSVLNQSKDILERRFEEIDSFTTHLNLNPDLGTLIMKENIDGEYNVYGLWKMAKEIAIYSYTNVFLNNFYIYMDKSNIILSPNSVFFRLNHFYEIYQYEDVPFDQWKETILKETQRSILPSQTLLHRGKPISVLTYVQPLPLGNINKQIGAVVVLIDVQEIHNLLEPILSQFGGWAYIANREGNILTITGIEEPDIQKFEQKNIVQNKFFKEDTRIISIQSDSTGWEYVAGIPEEVLFEQAYQIKRITWMVTLATLTFGLMISLFMANRYSNPIHKMLDIFKEQPNISTDKSRNVYDFLQGNISSLMSEHKSMDEALKRQRPLLIDALIRRMAKGELHSLVEIKAVMSQINLHLGGEFGYMGLVQIDGYGGLISKEILNELDASRLLIKEELSKSDHSYPIHVIDLESDKMIFICTFLFKPLDNMEKELEQLFHLLKNKLMHEYRISITVSFGSLFEELTDVSRSFGDAKYALDYSTTPQNGAILWYKNIVKENMTYYYPIDLELKLINVVKTGDYDGAERLISQIFSHNFTERHLSAEMAQQLISEIKGSLYKLIDPRILQDTSNAENLKKQVEDIKLTDSLVLVRSEIEGLLGNFCESVRNKRTVSDYEIIQQITDYISEVYNDADLSLFQIADAAGRPEKYISQLFKERTGESIPDYLESLRFKKAVVLLTQSDKTIDEISQCVGYNSAQSFRRAFKRISGVTPTSYRETVH